MAALVAAVIMLRVTRKFGTGILASGFKSISFGVLFIALAFWLTPSKVICRLRALRVSGNLSPSFYWLKLVLFVIGTYIIVIGSKKNRRQTGVADEIASEAAYEPHSF